MNLEICDIFLMDACCISIDNDEAICYNQFELILLRNTILIIGGKSNETNIRYIPNGFIARFVSLLSGERNTRYYIQ